MTIPKHSYMHVCVYGWVAAFPCYRHDSAMIFAYLDAVFTIHIKEKKISENPRSYYHLYFAAAFPITCVIVRTLVGIKPNCVRKMCLILIAMNNNLRENANHHHPYNIMLFTYSKSALVLLSFIVWLSVFSWSCFSVGDFATYDNAEFVKMRNSW